MPTASTSQILGNNECFEPFTSNIYVRRTIAGEFVVVNKYLMEELLQLKLWKDDIKNEIIRNNGSIQSIEAIPVDIKEKYKIVWEIPMKHIICKCCMGVPMTHISSLLCVCVIWISMKYIYIYIYMN